MAKSDDDALKEAKEAFDICAEREGDNRRDALDDLRFALLSEQWPANIRRDRELAGRPVLTVNRLPAFIRQVVNDARQNKPSIKVHPADSSADPPTAEIYNGLIRNIETTSKADVAYDTALESAVAGGFGYFRINTRYAYDDSFDLDLVIDRIADPFTVYGDPYSSASDSSDWNMSFVTDLMPKEVFRKKYKGAEEVDWEASGYERLDTPWMQENEILVAEYWTREVVPKTILLMSDQTIMDEDDYKKNKPLLDQMGISVVGERQTQTHKVNQQLMTGAEVLETNEWAGKYIPLVPVYGNDVHIQGKRYLRSLIRDAKDPQQMFNVWRTLSTELVGLAPKTPFIGPKGAFVVDQAKWETANSDNHAYIEYDGQVAPQRQPFVGVPAGALQEAMNASDDIKATMGLFDASLGAQSNEISGVAINARAGQGDVSTFNFIDNLSRAIEHGGRILIDLIPKVYSGERMIRVLGGNDNRQPSNVQLGRPVPVQGQNGQPQVDPATQLPITRIYDLGVGKYDLTVETGPSYTTQREEAANQMMELLKAFPAAAPAISDLLVKNLDWPGADEIAQRLQALGQHMMQPPAPPAPKPVDPGVAQAQMANAQAEVMKAQSDAKSTEMKTSISQQQLQIDAFRAQTERMVAQAELIKLQQMAQAQNVIPHQVVQ